SSEPALSFEYALDVLRHADAAGLGSAFITNGYMSEEALRTLAPYLGAVRIDLKAFSDTFYRTVCGAHLEPVLQTILLAKELGLHLELVTLIIPGYNDSTEEIDAMLSWETEHLGTLVPHHFTRVLTDVPDGKRPVHSQRYAGAGVCAGKRARTCLSVSRKHYARCGI
ncbi:MAG TPA: radical SAM protein, partial [Methanocorpusculum sp.]|nr:radical SAM protein [Methanocorpusculum sp.]